MSSIESPSMDLVCLTELVREYQNFIPDHPFINVTKQNLREKILELTKNQELLENKKIKSREWVVENHDISNVSQSLYSYYEKKSWIK